MSSVKTLILKMRLLMKILSIHNSSILVSFLTKIVGFYSAILTFLTVGSSENMSSIKDEFFKIQRNLELEFRSLPNASERKMFIVLK